MTILHRGIIADGRAMTAVSIELPYVKDEEPADMLARVSLKAGAKHREERRKMKLTALVGTVAILNMVFLPVPNVLIPLGIGLIILWTVWLVGHANRAIVFQKLVTWAASYSIRLTAAKIIHDLAMDEAPLVPVPDITIGTAAQQVCPRCANRGTIYHGREPCPYLGEPDHAPVPEQDKPTGG